MSARVNKPIKAISGMTLHMISARSRPNLVIWVLFWNYEDRAFPMGEKRLSMHKLPNGDTVFEQEVPFFHSPYTRP